jgi:hypothetical protein
MVDIDNDPIYLTVDFGPASNFLSLNGITSIECQDISSKAAFNAGMYLVKIMLNDKKDTVSYILSIFVIDLPPEPVAPVSSQPAAPGKNETVTGVEEKPVE